VLDALFEAEDNEELKVVEAEELELDKLELGKDEDGVGLGDVEGGGGVVDGGGCEVVIGTGGSCKVDVGKGGGAGALPNDHVP
jgi:hypothetical protein